MLKINKDGVPFNYVMLFFVIIIWGISPIFTKYMYEYNSASIHTAFGQTIAALSLLLINIKKLKLINKDLLKTAGLTGFILGIANVLQKIGFQYTTPSNYAFLENLSVVVVPILGLILYKKRPNFLTILTCLLCLGGCAVLCNLFESFSLKGGDVLCALAGAFYGVNIVVTGANAKKFDSGLYIMIQMIVGALVAFITAVVLNFVVIDGKVLEPIRFTFRWDLILLCIAVVLISNTLCWTLRTNALKVVDATVVAITMPLSAVITSVVSVLSGQENYSTNLLIGAILILLSAIISGLIDVKKPKKQLQ